MKKVVFISGSTSGIGLATARLMAVNGFQTIISGKSQDKLERTATELKKQDVNVDHFKLDVVDLQEYRTVVKKIVSKYGRIDILINNAGVMPLSYLEELKTDEWNMTIDVNLKGTLNGVASVIPYMKSQGDGHIINISSIAGMQVAPSTAVYSATKSAVRSISEGIRQEFKGIIRSTSICPGVVKTALAQSITNKSIKESVENLQSSSLSSEDIANTILYVASLPRHISINELVIRSSSH